jgi:hypothetical protein
MEKQNLELTKMIQSLSERVDAIPDLKTREKTDDLLSGIREATGALNESVRSISETLTALSEEV